MKINAVHIASFGKFKNYTLDFSDGFNMIYGENENGKSTVMAFIKMMFYGSATKSGDLAKNLRKKYQPWDSDIMAGSVDFTHGSVRYRLEREFKGSNAKDKITLMNLDLGTRQPLSGNEDIGLRFFGLSGAAFERSVFIGGLGVPDKDEAADGEINSKLANIVTTGDEDVSLDLVNKRLLKAKETLMSRSGRVGAYDKAVRELAELETEIRRARETEAEAARTEACIAEKEQALARTAEEANRLFEILKNAERIKKRDSLEKYIDACNKIDEVQKKLVMSDGQIADEEYLSSLENILTEGKEQKRRIGEKADGVQQLEEEIDRLSASLQEGGCRELLKEKAQMQAELEGLARETAQLSGTLEMLKQSVRGLTPVKKNNLPLLLCGGTASAVGLVLMVLSLFTELSVLIGAAVLAAGVLAAVCGLLLKKTVYPDDSALRTEIAQTDRAFSEKTQKSDELTARLERLNEQINAALIESGSRKALLEARQQELLAKKEELLTEKSRLMQMTSALSSLCARFRPVSGEEEAAKLAEELKALIQSAKEAQIRKNLAADGTGCSSKEEAASRIASINADESIKGMSREQLDSAKDDLKQKTDESGRLRAELAALKSELKSLTASGEPAPVLEQKYRELSETVKSQKQFCDCADLAMQTLAAAFAQLRQNFSSALEEKTSTVFSALTGGDYPSVSVSKSFDINVAKDGVFGMKEWQYLSAGTADQAYFSLRLALASLITEGSEPLPLMLDDVLAQYDDKRAEKAVKFLKQYAEEHQVLFFTCHSSFAQMAEPFTEIKKL